MYDNEHRFWFVFHESALCVCVGDVVCWRIRDKYKKAPTKTKDYKGWERTKWKYAQFLSFYHIAQKVLRTNLEWFQAMILFRYYTHIQFYLQLCK